MYVSHLAAQFTPEQLLQLQRAYNGALDELGIDLSEQQALKRARVSAIIIQMALHGELDPHVLQKCAVLRLANDRQGALSDNSGKSSSK